jgi:hypothetical protein
MACFLARFRNALSGLVPRGTGVLLRYVLCRPFSTTTRILTACMRLHR